MCLHFAGVHDIATIDFNMDEQPPTKKQKRQATPPSEGRPLGENLESLANTLKTLQNQLDFLRKYEKLPIDLSDVQALQAQLMNFQKKLDKIDKPLPKHICPECKTRFLRLDRLFTHCQKYHPNRDFLRMECSCQMKFKNLRDRNVHLRASHKREYEQERLLIEESELSILQYPKLRLS